MSTALLFLAMVLTPSVLVIAWLLADEWLAVRADKKARIEQDREADAEWFALLAATETPIYDELTCEQIEKAEGWS